MPTRDVHAQDRAVIRLRLRPEPAPGLDGPYATGPINYVE